MNPDEMLEQLSHMLRGPLSTMRHADFLQSEATCPYAAEQVVA